MKVKVLFFDRRPASETPWTEQVWFYDLRTNKHPVSRPTPSRAPILISSLDLTSPRIG